jgi:hypothetical protein
MMLALALAAGSVSAYQRFAKQDAVRFNAKLTAIVERGKAKPRAGTAPRTTLITDTELNAYFQHDAKDQIPVGIVDPSIQALGGGFVVGALAYNQAWTLWLVSVLGGTATGVVFWLLPGRAATPQNTAAHTPTTPPRPA